MSPLSRDQLKFSLKMTLNAKYSPPQGTSCSPRKALKTHLPHTETYFPKAICHISFLLFYLFNNYCIFSLVFFNVTAASMPLQIVVPERPRDAQLPSSHLPGALIRLISSANWKQLFLVISPTEPRQTAKWEGDEPCNPTGVLKSQGGVFIQSCLCYNLRVRSQETLEHIETFCSYLGNQCWKTRYVGTCVLYRFDHHAVNPSGCLTFKELWNCVFSFLNCILNAFLSLLCAVAAALPDIYCSNDYHTLSWSKVVMTKKTQWHIRQAEYKMI